MSDMYVITATSVHYSDVANVMQLYMYCNSTLYNDKIHKNHRETEHMQNLHLICIVSQHCLKPATTPPPPSPSLPPTITKAYAEIQNYLSVQYNSL